MPKSKKRVLYAPSASHTQMVFTPKTHAQLTKEFTVADHRGEKALAIEQIEAQIAGHDALITGWGVPNLTAKVFENGDRLKIIAHSAGTIKKLVNEKLYDQYVVPRGIVVFSAYKAIAFNVAETTIGMLIIGSRRWVSQFNGFWETGKFNKANTNGQFLMGATVGVVSASAVGRAVISLLKLFPGVHVLLYDPYVTKKQAKELGAEKVELNELFERSHHVTIHAPTTPETEKMIGAKQLKLLRDEATLLNTSRGWVLDHDALLRECQKGRFQVVLDTTTPEPLPPDSPFRQLRNVMVTPHIAARGYYGYGKIGEYTLQALRDCFAGKPVDGAIPRDRLAITA